MGTEMEFQEPNTLEDWIKGERSVKQETEGGRWPPHH